MATKKELMTCDAKEFIAMMNAKHEPKRKSSPAARSVKHHKHKGF